MALLGVGRHAPRPPRAAPPGAPSRTGPLLPRSPSRRGFRARVRRWRGWATACGCPCPTPSPWRFSGFWRNSKRGQCEALRGDSGGVPPVVGRRWATRPRRWAARVQPQAVPAVHGLGEVAHGRPGYRAHATHRVRSESPQSRASAGHPSTLVARQPDTCRTPARHFLARKCLTSPILGDTLAVYFLL